MKLTEFSVRNHAFTIVATLGLVALGVFSFLRIPRSEDPDLRIPVMNTIVVLPGSNPADLEKLVARPLEDSIKELDDLRKLTTTVRDGLVIISGEFQYGTDPEKKYDDVLRQVNSIRETLPSGIQKLEVKKVQTINVALAQVAIVSDTASYATLQDLAEDLRKRFEAIPGIRKSEKWAYPEKQVRVEIDPDKMAKMRIPPSRLIEAIQGNNLNIPAGGAETGHRRFTVKTTGNYVSLDEIRNTPLQTDGRAAILVKDLATVFWDYEETEYIGRFKGKRAVFVTAMPQRGRDATQLSAGLNQAMDEFVSQLPGDVTLERGFDQSRNIKARLGRLEADFLLAFALVLITVLPLGWRASLLVMLSIPLSLALGIALLDLSGYSLNQLSIVGCVIALGLLVDDSIVVVENIVRFRREGRSAIDAAITATTQIAPAVVGTTATLLFAFLPLLMLPGGPGQFIRSLPLAVVYTVTASLLVSLTVVPFLASRFLGRDEPAEGNWLLRTLHQAIHTTYRPLLHWCMKHRLATLGLGATLFLLSLGLLPSIGFSLFPKVGTPQFEIRVEGGEGNSVAATDEIVRKVEELLRASPEIEWWFANSGHGNPQIYYNEIPGELQSSTGDLFCQLKHFDPRRTLVFYEKLRAQLATIPGARIVLKEFENGPPVNAPIEIRIAGADPSVLSGLAAETEQLLIKTPGTLNVDNPLRVNRTDLRVKLDKPKAALLGVAEAELDRTVRTAFAGYNVSRFREADGDEYNITLAMKRRERAGLENWSRLQVISANGNFVPIVELATLEFESAPPLIQRYNRRRVASVTSNVQQGYNTAKLTQQIAAQLDHEVSQHWPRGYRYEFGGEVESSKESFGGLGGAILLATAGILAVLVLEFRSFRGTLVVASVIPLGVIGGLAGLYLSGYTLSFTASIGFIALVGIEIKNSILLVDFTNQLRAQGVPLAEAIERAGEVRFLPVVLTSLTALGALVPLAIAQSAMYSPLAIVIMGGLISSLLLSRVVTPVMYSLVPPPQSEMNHN